MTTDERVRQAERAGDEMRVLAELVRAGRAEEARSAALDRCRAAWHAVHALRSPRSGREIAQGRRAIAEALAAGDAYLVVEPEARHVICVTTDGRVGVAGVRWFAGEAKEPEEGPLRSALDVFAAGGSWSELQRAMREDR